MTLEHRVRCRLYLMLSSVENLPVLLMHVHVFSIVNHLELSAKFRDGLAVLTGDMCHLPLDQKLLHQFAQDLDLALRLFLEHLD